MVSWFILLAVLVLLQRRVTLLGLVYSASSSGPSAAEGYFAGVGFTLLAVLVLLQQRVTLLVG